MSESSLMSEPALDEAFLFLSAHRSIRAHGAHCRIDAPAARGGEADGALARATADAFARARAAGIRRPIVMGAIPFDADRPSELFIPRQYEFIDRAPLLAAARAERRAGRLLASRSVPDAAGFQAAVRQALQRFEQGQVSKAVLSRILELDFADPVAVDAVFEALCAQNPQGYQFRLPLADGGRLIGVSPELLLRKEGARLETFPLAGSAKRQPDAAGDAAAAARLRASAKDHYEHSLVVEDIRAVLSPVCASLAIPDAPDLLSTRAMWHLGSAIEGRLADPALSALQLACRLHPTPAVCGFPTAAARALIAEIEPFDRGVFSGMVGWCDEEGDGEWVVTIRCAAARGRSMRLFAGAGIVAGSSPEAEWAETEAKLGTMLAALGVSEQERAA